jgi:hypothetical protein
MNINQTKAIEIWQTVITQAVKDLEETDCNIREDALSFLQNNRRCLEAICISCGWDYDVIQANLQRKI